MSVRDFAHWLQNRMNENDDNHAWEIASYLVKRAATIVRHSTQSPTRVRGREWPEVMDELAKITASSPKTTAMLRVLRQEYDQIKSIEQKLMQDPRIPEGGNAQINPVYKQQTEPHLQKIWEILQQLSNQYTPAYSPPTGFSKVPGYEPHGTALARGKPYAALPQGSFDSYNKPKYYDDYQRGVY